MTKQNHLMQIERYKVLLKYLLATAISLSLITAFLTVPQSAYAAYTATVSDNTETLTGDSTNDHLILATDSLQASLLVAPAVYSSTLLGNTATIAGNNLGETLIIDVDGGNLLQHNRFTFGDPGFESGTDWDSTQLGIQTLTNAPGVTIRVRSATGDDVIILGTVATPASLLVATFDINGQNNADTLTINDSSDVTARNVSVSSSSITGIGGPPITYASIETIWITTGAGNDALNLNDQGTTTSNTYTILPTSIQRTVAVTGVAVISYTAVENLTLNSGNGNDSFNVGNASNSLDNLPSVLTFNGGANGTDSVTLNETAETGANTYTITPNSLQRGAAVINYDTTLDNLTVNAAVASTDSLVVTGTLGLGVKTYSVTSSSIQRSGVATITYSAVNNLLLNGGSTDDIFNLQSIGISTTVKGDAGDDTFIFANNVNLQGGTIDGAAGNDKLDYSAYATPVTVNLASNSATGTAGILSIKDVTGGLDNDTLTGNTSANNINGGPGNDVLNGMIGVDSLVGGPGNDTYNFSPGWGTDTIVEDAGEGNNDSMDFSAITRTLTITINSVTATYLLNTATHSGNEIESVVSGSDDDTFHVNASALSSHSISLDGGPHPTGDVLNFNAAGFTVITNTNTITAAGHQPLFYTRIEQVNITSTIPLFLPIILK